MYKLNIKEENGELKRSISISKQDAVVSKEFATIYDIAYIANIVKEVLKNDKKEEFIEFFDEEIINYLSSCDWLYNYDNINNFSLEELKKAKNELDKLLFDEKLKLDIILKSSLNTSENLFLLNNVLREINKYKYQIHTLLVFANQKFGVNNLDFESKTK